MKPFRISIIDGGYLLHLPDSFGGDLFPSIAAAMDYVCQLSKLRAI